MRVTLLLDDDLADIYQQEAAERHVDLSALLAERLAKAGELDPRSRFVIVAGRSLERLEILTGGLHIHASEELLQKVARLARIHFGDHDLILTPGQKEEIAYMATKQSKPVALVLSEMWTRFCDEFFQRLPARTA